MADTKLTEKLAKIRFSMESEAGEHDLSPDDIKRIIARMNGGDYVPVTVYQEEFGRERPLDFKKFSFDEKKLSRTLSFLAGVFNSFRAPMTKLALMLSSLPVFYNARSLLESAGIDLKAEAFVALVASTALLVSISFFFIVSGTGFFSGDFSLLLVGVLGAVIVFFLTVFLAFFLVVSRGNSRADSIDRALPFALRQIATQVKAGLSFHKSLQSVSKSDYGLLSKEFSKVLSDLERGLSTEESLSRLYLRVRSKNLRKAVTQIIRALKAGGNMSNVVSDIADDVSFETRMKIRDFTEKLNFINVFFIMLAVVAPVAAAIMSAILQIPMFASSIPPYFIYFAFTGIALAMFMILFVIKKMEPAAW